MGDRFELKPDAPSWLKTLREKLFGPDAPVTTDAGKAAVASDITSSILTSYISKEIEADKLPGFLQTLTQWIDGFLGPIGETIRKEIRGNMIAYGFLTPQQADEIFGFFGGNGTIGGAGALVVGMLILLETVKGSMESMGGLVTQRINATVHPNLPDPASMIKATMIDPSLKDRMNEVLSRHGFNSSDADIVKRAMYALLDPTTIRDAYFRGSVTQDEARAHLASIGFTDGRINTILSTWSLIPGPQDLISMAVKEAFDDDFARENRTDEGLPAEFVTWAGKQGLSADWCKRYWREHWQLPSPNQVFEMLHRGQIDFDALDRYLKAADYAPFWRDKLRSISYNPYTRVDVRRMYKLGILAVNEVRKAYRDIGYDEEHAENLTQFTIRELEGINKEVTKGEIIKSYVKHLIDNTEAETMLRELGYGQEETDFILNLADLEMNRENYDTYISFVKKAFIEGVLDRDESELRLVQFNVYPPTVSFLIQRWELERETNRKKPTQSQLDKWRESRLLSTDEYREEMRAIGWSDKYIDMFVGKQTFGAVAEYGENVAPPEEAPEEIRKQATKSDLDALYIAGQIDRGEYLSKMGEIGYEPKYADLFLAQAEERKADAKKREEAQAAREGKPAYRGLSKQDADSLYLSGQIDIEAYRVILSEINYAADAIAILSDAIEAERARREAEKTAASEKKETVQPRMLSKSELDALLLSGIIERDDYIRGLLSLRYSESDAEKIYAVMRKKMEDLNAG